MNAVYLGMIPQTSSEPLLHKFCVDGIVRKWQVAAVCDFLLQNTLEIGQTYSIRLNGCCVIGVQPCKHLSCFPPPSVQGTPGLRTLKNLLATAMEPMGRTLYVYGGGWNWQDTGAGPQATSIGPAPSWNCFFQEQDAQYDYHSGGHYPFNGKNPYYFAGLDCSGYLGWVVYNTLHTQGGLPGYVQPSVQMALDFARRGWGTWEQFNADSFAPGDVYSISGHVWLCMGSCGDGSILLAHSTPSESLIGCPGGGVQLSALSSQNSPACEAHQLALDVTKRCFHEWNSRYTPVIKDYALYTNFSSDSTGRFRWALDGSGVLQDPEGISGYSAQEVLNELLNEH